MAALLSHSDKSPLWQSLGKPSQLTHPNSQRGTIPPGRHRPSERKKKKIPLIESEDVPPNQLSITNKVQLWILHVGPIQAYRPDFFWAADTDTQGNCSRGTGGSSRGPKDRIRKEKIPREWPESRTSGGGPPQGGRGSYYHQCLLSLCRVGGLACRRWRWHLRAGRPRRCVPLLTAGQVILLRLLLHQQPSMCCGKKKNRETF